MLTVLAVAVRVVSNPLSNVFQKQLAARGGEPLAIIAATHGILAIVLLPLLFSLPLGELTTAFWGSLLAAVLLAVAGNATLVAALRSADLSVLGPINAYKSVLSLLLAAVLLGEVPTLPGLAGVMLIVWGSYFVIDRSPGQTRRSAFREFTRDRGVRLRVAALACTATEAVFLKRALLLSSPLTTFVLWAVLGFPIALSALASMRTSVAADATRWRGEWGTYVALAATTGLMQLTTLLTFATLQVGYALALFQLSTLLTVYLGHRYFEEQNVGRRLLGAVIMVAGAILIVTR